MSAAYTIRIGSTGDTSGVDKVTGALKRADQAADEFVQSIKAGVGIDIGGKIVNSIAAIPGVLQSAISRGVEFNVAMNTAEVGISNVLAKFMDLDQEAAKREAAKAMQQLIDLEPKAAGGLKDLVDGFMATGATALSMGLTVEQNIDLVGKFANALSNAGKPIEQLGQEMRSLLTGQATQDSDIANMLFGGAAKANEAIKLAKETGTVYDLIIEKIGKFGEAGDSAAVRMSSFDSAVSKALGKITEPVFDAFIDGVKELTEAIDKDGGRSLKDLGFQIGEIVKIGVSFTKLMIEHSELVQFLAKSVGGLAAAWGAFQIAALVVGMNRKAAAILTNKAALDAESASLARNTTLQTQNAAGRAAGAATDGGAVAGRGLAGKAVGVVGAGLTGLGLGHEVQSNVFNWASSQAFGGASTEMDLQKAQAFVKDRQETTQSYVADAKAMTTEEARAELIKKMTDDLKKMSEARNELAWNESGQKQMIDDEMASMNRLLETVQKLSLEKAQQAEKEKALAAAEKKAEEDKIAFAAASEKILTDRAARRQDSARDRTASEKLDQAADLIKKGDTAGAKQSLDEQEQYFRDWLAQAQAAQGGKTGDDLKDNLDLQDQLQGYLEKIAEARADLPDAIAKADDEAKKKQIETLTEQLEYIEAQGQLRLAQANEDGDRRKQIEDDIAAKRLALENQIGALQEESALKRQAREIAYAASAIQRTNALADTRASELDKTDPGDLFSGTRRRRGSITSDTFEQGIDVNRASQPLTNFQDALRGGNNWAGNAGGAIPPTALPPPIANPLTPTVGGNAQQPPAGGAPATTGQGIADATGNLTEAVKAIEETAATGLEETTEAVKSVDNTLRRELSKLKQRLSALEDGL